MLAPQPKSESPARIFLFTCQSRDLYPAFAAALLEETGIDIELDTTGTLYLAVTEHDAQELETRYEWRPAGLALQKLGASEVRLLERQLMKT